MGKKSLSIEQANKFIDAHLVGSARPNPEDIAFAVDRVNQLIADEAKLGVGPQTDQHELFTHLVNKSRKQGHWDAISFADHIVAKMVLLKWAEQSQNLYAMAYQVGHGDGNINGSFHTAKRERRKAERVKDIQVKRAANGRRLIGSTSRAKVAKAAEEFRHLSKEKAAAEIAEIVNLDPGTIRRYLTQAFPGEEWRKK